MKRGIFSVLAALSLTSMLFSCGGNSDKTASDNQSDETHKFPDTLRVATLYSPEAYFIYRGQEMGYDFELVTALAADKDMILKMEIAPSLSRAVEMLDSGYVDLIAYEVPVTAEYKDRVVPCGPENITTQVLVQPIKGETELITDVTDLVGKDVYVESESKYEARIRNLNQEVGGGINIHTVDRDTLITEDLIAMVSEGKIPLTVVDSDIARINKTYYSDLDITLPLSFEQRSSWAVAPDKAWLGDSINAWLNSENPRQEQAQLLKRYFELSKNDPNSKYYAANGVGVSPFDHLFKRYAEDYDWDWKLLASQAYVESKFDSTAVSWAGARGMMQIMPRTAKGYGQTAKSVMKNDVAVETALKLLNDLDKQLTPKVPDENERKKFVLAAYNSGLGHVNDAINLAKKYGLNPQKWDGNVAKAILWKSNPKYYKDPVVRFGYSRGRETYDYVNRIYAFYNRAKTKAIA
ncbi:MAG: transglycosylase SLT domain-containing protein [Duncaniella sp.]|uniref:transglycosylase SLT domain-containing protein n=1 Tax=Duncaniella sp. TaxID=2518496 RepID=UPI0023C194BA|nr:transglycosylase SLT domain-containing protein [Duncaniella sp.]MDE6091002.1 transglycosylase SLT domain-containing protein [Duncaniella sp.]